jgi:hypothetical protein
MLPVDVPRVSIPNGALQIPVGATVSSSFAATLSGIQSMLQNWLDKYELGDFHGPPDVSVNSYRKFMNAAVSSLQSEKVEGYFTLLRSLRQHSEAIKAADPISQLLESQLSHCDEPTLHRCLMTRIAELEITVRSLHILVDTIQEELYRLVIRRHDKPLVTRILSQVCDDIHLL